jgi:hypothetical protein
MVAINSVALETRVDTAPCRLHRSPLSATTHPPPNPLRNKAEAQATGAPLANMFENDPSLYLVCAAHAKPSANHF